MVNALEVTVGNEEAGLDTGLQTDRGRNYGDVMVSGTRIDHYSANGSYTIVFYPIGDEVKIRSKLRINEPRTKEVPGMSHEDVEQTCSEKIIEANVRPNTRTDKEGYIMNSYNQKDIRMVQLFIDIL